MLHDPDDERLFPKLTAEQIETVRALGEVRDYKDGEIVFEPGRGTAEMYVVLTGMLRISRIRGSEDELLAVHRPGEFSGDAGVLLNAVSTLCGKAVGDTQLIRISSQQVRHLIGEESPLANLMMEALLHRSKQLGQYRNHEEKMAALGKMSAGLAHELNNPATAARRASALMLEAVFETPARMSQIETRHTPEQREHIKGFTALLQQKTKDLKQLDPLEQSDLEQELMGWLEDHQIPRSEDIACTLAATGLSTKELEEWDGKLGDAFVRALYWAETVARLSELARDIESSTGRIADLVSAMKDYTYMDQARFQEIDVHQGIESTLKILQHKLKKGVRVRREYGSDLPKICAYAGELNQVWTNVIDNAVDAMNGDGVLTVKTSMEEERIVVEVCDNGSGIAPENMSKLFEPFFTTKPVGKGTGLGLDIAYRIVTHRHGGEIRVRSKPGETCFEIYLPQNPPREEEVLQAAQQGEA